MNRRFIPLLLTIISFLFVSCSNTAPSDSQNNIQSITSSVSDQSDTYDPFKKEDVQSITAGSYNYGVEWEENKRNVLDYDSTVSLQYFVENNGKATDFGVLFFINGFCQPYRTEDDREDKILHIFQVDQNERKVKTIEFEPVVGEFGDELSVEIVSMFEPDYINTEKSNYDFHHRISSLFPSKMSVTKETGLSEPNVCLDYTNTSITEEMRLKFDTIGAAGASSENSLETNVHIETLKNEIFYTPADLLKSEPDNTPFTMNDSVSLCMYGGKQCKYRVSMFVNHEQVKGAFDGLDYIDMTVSGDSICKKTIDLNKLNLSLNDYNHVYFIAVPFYSNDNYIEKTVIKSTSVTLKH